MKIAFFGLGKAGKRHYGILQQSYNHELYAFKHPISWAEVDKVKPDIAFITNPTHKHIETALECAKRDMQLFIEKPIDCRLGNLNQLLEVINRKNLTAYIAYPYRHHPKIQFIKKNPTLKGSFVGIVCKTDIRKWGSEYSWREETGGGVLLELSHEIDYAEYLSGEIISMEGIHTTGFANITLKHKDGTQTYLILDLLADREERYIKTSNMLFYVIDLLDKKDMYERQMGYFLANIHNPGLINNINEASVLFKKIIDFKCRVF